MVKAWGGIMLTFLAIAVMGIGLILQPVKLMTSTTESAPSAITTGGMILRVEAWKKYPEYNTGLGTISIIAFGGAIYSSAQMYLAKQKETDALESKTRGL